MLMILYLLLILRVGRCTDDPIFETKIVGVGEDVKLTCTRGGTGTLFWIRVVSGNVPEVLGKTSGFESVYPHIMTSKETGAFILHIRKAKLSDTAVYYCMKTQQSNFIFSKGTDLRVGGPEPDISPVPPSDPVRPGDSVTLQCSVLSDFENKTCPAEHDVYWFRAGSNQSHPIFNHTQENGVEEHERNSEGLLTKKCIYSFFKNVSSSDAGTSYCAVATCEEILSGNRSKPATEVNMWDSHGDNTILFSLCVVLAISVIVIASLICSIKDCDCCNDTATTAGQQNQHLRNLRRNEDTWVYSAAIFTVMKVGSDGTRGDKAGQREGIYASVKAFGLN